MLFLPFLVAAQALAAAPIAQDAIYRGHPVGAGGTSWRSTVGLNLEASNGQWFACTGVFLETDVILTAAHCAEGITNASNIYVNLYKENSTAVTTLYPDPGTEVRILAHPGYAKYTTPSADDLAVIVLRNQTLPDGFRPALVQGKEQADASNNGETATVVGTGRNEKNAMSDRVYYAQGTFSSYQTGDIAVIDFTSDQGICGGDSGGPIFVSQGGQLYLSALNTAVDNNLGNSCGNRMYANAITSERYDWAEAAAVRMRAAMAK
jgi:secreted trypsin-like serine protease